MHTITVFKHFLVESGDISKTRFYSLAMTSQRFIILSHSSGPYNFLKSQITNKSVLLFTKSKSTSISHSYGILIEAVTVKLGKLQKTEFRKSLEIIRNLHISAELECHTSLDLLWIHFFIALSSSK